MFVYSNRYAASQRTIPVPRTAMVQWAHEVAWISYSRFPEAGGSGTETPRPGVEYLYILSLWVEQKDHSGTSYRNGPMGP